MSFSVVIPTYKREKDLSFCLNSILEQSLLPAEIVLIDDGELPAIFLNNWKNKLSVINVDFVYHKKDHQKETKGSSCSRNIGLKLSKKDKVFILDDDLIMEKEYFRKSMEAFDGKKKLIGVGGIITNNRKKNLIEEIYNKIFFLSGKTDWDINGIGFQSWNDYIGRIQKAFYVHGGVCVYNKNIVNKLEGFSVFGGGREALEDLDFCWRAKKAGYYFLINPAARVFHKHSQISRESAFLTGKKEGHNRLKIFKRVGQQSPTNIFLFYWASLGLILRQILILNFKTAAGMIVGLIFN